MTRLRSTAIAGALVTAALIGGMLIGSVAAAPATQPASGTAAAAATPSASPAAKPGVQYCEDFRAAFAANLGATEDEVVAAAKAAVISTLDKAVADGRMTADAAAKAKTLVEAAPGDGCSLLAGWKGRFAARGSDSAKRALGLAKGSTDAMAAALGLTTKELRAEFRSGKSLMDIAAAQGVSYEAVSAAVLKAVEGSLDELVKAGKITQERADKALANTKERLADGWVHKRAKDRAKAPPTPTPAP